MNILTVGNSFSEDSGRYLHRIARADKFNLETINLYIGGCSLDRHYRNMLGDKKDYVLTPNGEFSSFFVTLKEALLNRSWDYISIQQASLKSAFYDTYQPYLNELVSYFRKMCPSAKIIIHQTWGYEEGSEMMKSIGFSNHTEMFAKIEESYDKAFLDSKADLLILSGKLISMMYEKGLKMHRDGFHLSYGLGRYAAGLLWYRLLSGNDVTSNSFSDFDEEVSPEEIRIAKECVEELVKSL